MVLGVQMWVDRGLTDVVFGGTDVDKSFMNVAAGYR